MHFLDNNIVCSRNGNFFIPLGRMRIIARSTLKSFWEKSDYQDSEQQLKAWHKVITERDWKDAHEITQYFTDADHVGNGRIVFNICRNKYRLIVAFRYDRKIGFIRFAGTHKQYDKIKIYKAAFMKQSIEIRPIRSKRDYKAALKQIESLWDVSPDSKEADQLEVLAILVDEYEQKHFPIEAPDPIEAIKYRMEQLNLSQQDLAKYLGGKNRVSEVLNRKRPLTLKMIKALHVNLHIPAEALIA